MQPPLRILLFDDDSTDAELVRRELRRQDPDFQILYVATEVDYLQALWSFVPDIILSDFKLPLHGGAFALKMARELRPGTPFIFVSGAHDEPGKEMFHHGAFAFVSKSRLEQLGPAIGSALKAVIPKNEGAPATAAPSSEDSPARRIGN